MKGAGEKAVFFLLGNIVAAVAVLFLVQEPSLGLVKLTLLSHEEPQVPAPATSTTTPHTSATAATAPEQHESPKSKGLSSALKFTDPLFGPTQFVHLREPEGKHMNANKNRIVSSIRCAGNINSAANLDRRCLLTSVCLQDSSLTQTPNAKHPYFPVVRFMQRRHSQRPLLFEQHMGEMFVLPNMRLGFKKGEVVKVVSDSNKEELGHDSVAWYSKTPVMFMRRHENSNNPGHMIWEELSAAYLTVAILGIAGPVQLVFVDTTKAELVNAAEAYRFFAKSVFGLPPVSIETFLQQVQMSKASKSGTVCIRELAVGQGERYMYPKEAGSFMGTEPIMWAYRNRILEGNGLNSLRVPHTHKVVIVRRGKTASGRPPRRQIHNAEEVQKWLLDEYPGLDVSITQIDALPTWEEQMQLVINTTLMITPCGGVSAVVPFLPPGASAIIMDYMEGPPNPYVWSRINANKKPPTGDSVSMDAEMWQHFPHVNQYYYQIHSKKDFVADEGCRSEVPNRDCVSIVVTKDRMMALVHNAFLDMAVQVGSHSLNED